LSLQALATALSNQLPATGTGRITLDANTLNTSGATNITTLLSDINAYLSLSNQALVFSDLTKSDVPNPVNNVLTIEKGSSKFLNSQMSVVKLEFQMPDPSTLTVAFEGNSLTDEDGDLWYFSTSFPSFFVIPFLDNYLIQSSFIYSSVGSLSWAVNQKNLTLNKGLNFYTQLNMEAPSILTVVNLLGFFFKLEQKDFDFHLFGPIDLTQTRSGVLDFPSIALESPTKQTSPVEFFHIKVQNPKIGIRLVDIPGDNDNPQDVSPEFYFSVQIPIGDSIPPLDFSAAVGLQSNFLIFYVTESDPDHPLSIDQVCKELMGGADWKSVSQSIPPLLMTGLDSIDFLWFAATMFLGSTPLLSSFTTRIGSGRKISSPPVNDFNFYFDWTYLVKEKTNLFDFGSIVELDNIGTFSVEISMQ